MTGYFFSSVFFKANPFNKDLPAEVKALEDFLQKTGGSNGGWDQFDHQAFLRVRNTKLCC